MGAGSISYLSEVDLFYVTVGAQLLDNFAPMLLRHIKKERTMTIRGLLFVLYSLLRQFLFSFNFYLYQGDKQHLVSGIVLP